jgi:ATP-dependent DNA helicase RecG
MPSAFDKLNKILRLEQSQGYRNKAVIGGMENFAPIWQAEAQAEAGADPDQVDEIAALLAEYGDKDERERAELIAGVLEHLKQSGMAPVRREPQAERPAPAPGAVPAAPATGPAPQPRQKTTAGLDAPIETLPGISAGFGSKLRKLGIATVADLLYHFPHRYDDYRTLKPINLLEYGEETTIIGTIWDTKTRSSRGGSAIVSSIIADASGTIEAVWFNQPYLARQLRAGMQIVLSGKVEEHLGRLIMRAPTWEPLEKELIHTARLVPIYPLTQGISARWLRRLMKRVVDHWAPRLPDHLPADVCQRAGLMDLSTAIQQIHFPDSQEKVDEARRRLSFDEFLMIQLGMLRQRREWQSAPGVPVPEQPALLDGLRESLSFALTDAQQRSLDQILEDMGRDRPMSRLLQGDVGSGKTVVAAAAMLMAVAAGRQAALMAPTEILAQQHHASLSRLLAGADAWGLDHPVSVVLLTGSQGKAERQDVCAAISSGQAGIVVGTHALIQQQISFHDLALVIVDEQHRFGVAQRAVLRGKGASPHMLVMSATPIPRSLALTLYGDLDISVIDELPPGRQPIHTRWLLPRERERAYAFIRSQVAAGRQAFILYPLIEESEKIDARAAVDEYERLQETIFRAERLGLLHGKMKAREKEEVMSRFHRRELDILVSTSVVEVGIDVPNATVMLVEGADRFGLAQLHQFRGRVGRGEDKSYCLLLSDSASPDDPQTRATWERLKAIEDTQDGFVLAEKDLELRGPGDFIGIRQSGLPELRLASLTNTTSLEQARGEAQMLFDQDPMLAQPEHQLLAEKVARFWQGRSELS